jgi:hypothetical protein
MGAYWASASSARSRRLLRDDAPDAILDARLRHRLHARDAAMLMQLMCCHPEADAIAGVQAGAARTAALHDRGSDGENAAAVRTAVFASDLSPGRHGAFRADADPRRQIPALPKPWFHDVPAPDGSWGEGRIDADIAFWRQVGSGRQFALPRQPRAVGHLERPRRPSPTSGSELATSPSATRPTTRGLPASSRQVSKTVMNDDQPGVRARARPGPVCDIARTPTACAGGPAETKLQLSRWPVIAVAAGRAGLVWIERVRRTPCLVETRRLPASSTRAARSSVIEHLELAATKAWEAGIAVDGASTPPGCGAVARRGPHSVPAISALYRRRITAARFGRFRMRPLGHRFERAPRWRRPHPRRIEPSRWPVHRQCVDRRLHLPCLPMPGARR